MKLMIAVPTYGNMPMEFCRSLTGLVKRLTAEGVSFDVVFKPDTLVYLARDHLVMDAINGGYTHTLWLDSDIYMKHFDAKSRPFGRLFII